MFIRVSLISTATVIAATLTAAAQQLPPAPKGENTPRTVPSGPPPDATTGQRGATPSGKIGPGPNSQSTPQEPKGEESSQSATPSGEQPPPNPRQPRQ